MSATATASSTVVTQPELEKGALLADVFEIEAHVASEPLGQSYMARDNRTRKHVNLFVLAPALCDDGQVLGRIHAAAREAQSVSHAGLLVSHGSGSFEELHFIVREALSGRTAAQLIAERKAQKRSLSLRGVYNLIAHVGKAISALPPGMAHGALRPSVVWVTKSGRVKLGDLELGSAMVKLGRCELLPLAEQAFLAPEVKNGSTPDARSDVFGVGALLYALLTARSPLDAFVIPSQVRPDASPMLDAVMMRSLAADPEERYASVSEVVREILPLVAAAPEPEEDDFEVDVEIDVDVAASLAPPSAAGAFSLVPVIIVSETPAANDPPPSPKAPPVPQNEAERLAELTSRLTNNDAPRWISVKNGMDHGPFTARELIKLIVDGEVQESHILFNMGSSDRKPLAEYPELQPFVQQYRIRRDEQEHAQALIRSSQVEKRSNVAKFVILAVSIGAIALLGGGYFLNRKAAGERQRKEADLAALYESGQVRISGTAGILKLSPRPGGRRPASSGGAAPGGFSSYEDAMNQAMELGDATKGGGERQLASSDVAGVMNRELNRMFGCVGEELRRGGKLGHVVIDLAILGSGRVAGASVNAGSAGFQRCISTKLQNVRFPDFPAPRMGARYSFNVD
jgi:serine/threonine protein kinase